MLSVSSYSKIVLVGILLAGVGIRLVLIFAVSEPVDKDALEYYTLAKNLVECGMFSFDCRDPELRRGPGYPVILAAVMFLVGENVRYLYVFQAIVNIITVYLIFRSVVFIGINVKIALLIAGLFCFSPSFVYVNVLYSEIMVMLFVAFLVYINVHPRLVDRSRFRAVVSGIIVGIMIYTRPVFVYFPLFVIALVLGVWAVFRSRMWQKEYLLIVSITALVLMCPWSLRNSAYSGKFVPFVVSGGRELWFSNFAIDDGVLWYSVVDISKYEEQRMELLKREQRRIKELCGEEVREDFSKLDYILGKEIKRIIKAHPFRYLLLCLNRFLILWFSPFIGSTTVKSMSGFLFWLLLLGKYVGVLIAMKGMWDYIVKRNGELLFVVMVLYLTLLHSMVHSIQRYFLPLLPFVYFFAAVGVETFVSRLEILRLIVSKKKGCDL